MQSVFLPLVCQIKKVTSLIALTLVSLYGFYSQAEDLKKPHIILMMADDLGFAELGSYGQKHIKTPHLDRLAESGMKFTQHYTSAPVCAPARCSLMTGRHGGNAYVRNNYEIGSWESHQGQLPLPDKTETIASLLKKQGYRTGAFGKWGLGQPGSSGDPLKRGFDRFYGYNCQRHAHNYYPKYIVDDDKRVPLKGNSRSTSGKQYAPKLIADNLLEFISDTVKSGSDPFFIYYPTVIPHLALQVPEEDLALYKGEWKESPYKGNSYLPHPTPKSAYAAMITYMDKQVGRILELLQQMNIENNTLFLFTSDNGTTYLKGQVDYEFFKSVGNLKGLKGDIYEGGIRVPLIASWPGKIKPGVTSHHISAHYDILPTILDAAGVQGSSLPAHDGLSFMDALLTDGRQDKTHEALIWDFAGYGGQIAIRKGNWKLLQRKLSKNPKAPLELYDLASDPGEMQNLSSKFPELSQELHQLLIKNRSTPKIERFRFGQYRDSDSSITK